MTDYLMRQKIERALIDCIQMQGFGVYDLEGHKIIDDDTGGDIDLTELAERLADELGLSV